ncbi:nitrite reductase small subunit NirD [Deinococcus alpinitundrae]|uniref:nitrite reductase small subunit NirD n=1 Tax=Deinococcus alpinitundrae TaxID=468913 RepID=UPI00137B28D6|nr:nitrite reductase small subunit NirD [Deinococcus alpinitundrae]
MTQLQNTYARPRPQLAFTRVCALTEIPDQLGVCALVGGQQVAVFRLGAQVYALGNRDPFTGANVISRGLTGSYGERLKVVSPLLKHGFDLETGLSLDKPEVALPTYPVRLEGGDVWIGLPD